MKKMNIQTFIKKHSKAWRGIKYVGLPILIYFVLFTVLTWPWLPHFGTHFFTDGGDGYQNVWNMWWVERSVTELHRLPWYTQYLHFPFGVTLIGQTLNPFNGFVALGLLPFMHLNQAFNIMVIFSFVMGGLTAFWLCYYFAKAYVPSLIGGVIFTFSSYHFAHAQGHMQLVSLEWIPLFILLWWKFLTKPSYWLAAGSAVSLTLVLLCDYYYFLYSLIFAAMAILWFWHTKKLPDLKKATTLKPLGLLAGLGLLLVAPLPLALLRANSHTEFLGSHSARLFSTDIATPLLNGGFWKFHSLTDWYYKYLPANIFEATVYVTLATFTLIVISLVKRKKLPKELLFWQILIIFFGVMSLGPRLMVRGNTIEHAPMPYVIMERVVPGMKLSGMPVRMMVMVLLGSAVIAAMVLARLDLSKRKSKLIMSAFVLVLLVEIWPKPLPLTPANYSNYVARLKTLPSTGGVLDEAAKDPYTQLFNQTLHEKPMPFGYISRQPKELGEKELPIIEYNTQNKLNLLCSEFKIRYVTAPAAKPRNTTFPIIYQDNQAIIYDLKGSPNSNC